MRKFRKYYSNIALLISVIMVCTPITHVWGFDDDVTHPHLTEQGAKNSSLEDYVRKLGYESVNSKIKGKSIYVVSDIKDWIYYKASQVLCVKKRNC